MWGSQYKVHGISYYSIYILCDMFWCYPGSRYVSSAVSADCDGFIRSSNHFHRAFSNLCSGPSSSQYSTPRCAATRSAFCEDLLWTPVYKRCAPEHVLREWTEKVFPFSLPLIISKLRCVRNCYMHYSILAGSAPITSQRTVYVY